MNNKSQYQYQSQVNYPANVNYPSSLYGSNYAAKIMYPSTINNKNQQNLIDNLFRNKNKGNNKKNISELKLVKKDIKNKQKKTPIKREPIESRIKDIPNPKLNYMLVRVYEIAKIYNEIYLLKHKVSALIDEKNVLIDKLMNQNKIILREKILRQQILKEEKKKLIQNFIDEQKKILDNFKNK